MLRTINRKEKPQCPLFNIPMKQSKQWTAVSLEESYFKGREAKSFQPRPLPSPPLPPQLPLLTALIYSGLFHYGWECISVWHLLPSQAGGDHISGEVLVPACRLPLCYNCFPPCAATHELIYMLDGCVYNQASSRKFRKSRLCRQILLPEACHFFGRFVV